MKQLLAIALLFFFPALITAQKPNGKIEVTTYVQWDRYPQFKIPFNSAITSTIKINGTSWGIQGNYKHPLNNKFFVKAGIGYYKYLFSDIKSYNSLFGSFSNRDIYYTGGSATFSYVCNKYWYNTITATIGLEKLFKLKGDIDFIGGIDVTNYFTFSQRYNIPLGSGDVKYKKNNMKYFGLSSNLYSGLQKNIGAVKVGPTISFPIFNLWKQDQIFPDEDNSKSRDKWLRGFGVGISCNYSLIKIPKHGK